MSKEMESSGLQGNLGRELNLAESQKLPPSYKLLPWISLLLDLLHYILATLPF